MYSSTHSNSIYNTESAYESVGGIPCAIGSDGSDRQVDRFFQAIEQGERGLALSYLYQSNDDDSDDESGSGSGSDLYFQPSEEDFPRSHSPSPLSATIVDNHDDPCSSDSDDDENDNEDGGASLPEPVEYVPFTDDSEYVPWSDDSEVIPTDPLALRRTTRLGIRRAFFLKTVLIASIGLTMVNHFRLVVQSSSKVQPVINMVPNGFVVASSFESSFESAFESSLESSPFSEPSSESTSGSSSVIYLCPDRHAVVNSSPIGFANNITRSSFTQFFYMIVVGLFANLFNGNGADSQENQGNLDVEFPTPEDGGHDVDLDDDEGVGLVVDPSFHDDGDHGDLQDLHDDDGLPPSDDPPVMTQMVVMQTSTMFPDFQSFEDRPELRLALSLPHVHFADRPELLLALLFLMRACVKSHVALLLLYIF